MSLSPQRKAARVLAVCAALGWAAACQAAPLSAVDGRGKRVTLPAPPRRIVSLVPSATEILFALGLKGRIVADTDYCDYPKEARALPKIGGYQTSIEKVIVARPDLIVGGIQGNSTAVARLSAMPNLSSRLFAIEPRTLPELYASISALGAITGQGRQAAALVRGMQARAAAVAARVGRERTRPKVVFIVQEQPLWVAGAHTFVDDLITDAGGINVGRAAGVGYAPLSLERIVTAQPDVLLTGMEDPRSVTGRGGWSAVPAVRRRAMYALGPTALRPGPRLVDALERLARLLHPGAFR